MHLSPKDLLSMINANSNNDITFYHIFLTICNSSFGELMIEYSCQMPKNTAIYLNSFGIKFV